MPTTVTLENVTPVQLILRYLALEGATTVFGVPGSAVMQFLYEFRVRADTFTFVICRHETGAAFMADGYARASGGLGVVLATSGPGATNALTGAMNAHACGTPLLTITGEVREAFFGLGYLQEGADGALDINAIYSGAVGYTALIDNRANCQALLEQALRTALTVPTGASHLSLPGDIAVDPIPSVRVPSAPEHYRATARGTDERDIDTALDALLAAERPLLFLGNGARRALADEPRLAALATFVEQYALPVMTTPEAKGIFPESHALSLRNYGLAGCDWTTDYLQPGAGEPPYDALLVIGSSLGELATTKIVPEFYSAALLPAGPFFQIDAEAHAIGRAFPVDLGIVADAGAAIDSIVAQGSTRPVPDSAAARAAYIAELKATKPATPPIPEPGAGTVHPAALITALDAVLPAGAHVFVDAGNCVGWCNAYLTVDPPTRAHSALAQGPMGFAVCAVIGAKLAAPDAACVAVTGDGAFLMQGNELSTAAAHGVGAIWIVLDDGDLGMVTQGMEVSFPGLDWSGHYGIGNTDLVAYARSLGANAVAVTATDALPAALEAAFAGAAIGVPQVLAVKIDPTAVPPYYE